MSCEKNTKLLLYTIWKKYFALYFMYNTERSLNQISCIDCTSIYSCIECTFFIVEKLLFIAEVISRIKASNKQNMKYLK